MINTKLIEGVESRKQKERENLEKIRRKMDKIRKRHKMDKMRKRPQNHEWSDAGDHYEGILFTLGVFYS